jgi:hypothetical protein
MGSIGTLAELFKDRMGQGPTRGHKGYKRPEPPKPAEPPAPQAPRFNPAYPNPALPPDQMA